MAGYKMGVLPAEDPRLQSVHIRGLYHQKSAAPQKLAAFPERRSRIRQVFQKLYHGYYGKVIMREGMVRQRAHVYRIPEYRLCMGCGVWRNFNSMGDKVVCGCVQESAECAAHIEQVPLLHIFSYNGDSLIPHRREKFQGFSLVMI